MTNGLIVSGGDISLNHNLLVGGDSSFNGTMYLGGPLLLGPNSSISMAGSGVLSLPANSISTASIDNSGNGRFVETGPVDQTISGTKTFSNGLYYDSSVNYTFYNPIPPDAQNPATFNGDSQVATTSYVGSAIQYLVGAAPAVLDTIYEIATSLSGDASAVYNLTQNISTKVNRSGDGITGNLSIGNVIVPNRYTLDVSGTANISKTLNVELDASFNAGIYVNGNINNRGSTIYTSYLEVMDISSNGNVVLNTGDLTLSQGNVNLSTGNINLTGTGEDQGFIVQF
jgi:hypothetical protein